MARYATTIEASKRWNMTPEAICQKCERGEVSGARRFVTVKSPGANKTPQSGS